MNKMIRPIAYIIGFSIAYFVSFIGISLGILAIMFGYSFLFWDLSVVNYFFNDTDVLGFVLRFVALISMIVAFAFSFSKECEETVNDFEKDIKRFKFPS